MMAQPKREVPVQGPNWGFGALQVNNLIKRVKRAAFGFRHFRNYRVRALLYAGKPDWSLLRTVRPAVG
jgi:hypothetical protein